MKKSPALIVFVLLACMHASSSPLHTTKTYDGNPVAPEQIRSNLYLVESDASTILLDGDLTQYDASFSNVLDGMDARKMSNFSENLGMIRENTTLVIERRHTIEITDTIFYKLWNAEQKDYQLEFITSNLDHPGLAGYLEDSYLHTSAPVNLNGATHINFSVNADPASSAIYRFRIIFNANNGRFNPFAFTTQGASRLSKAIRVDWGTQDELNMKFYDIERSATGKQFSTLTGISANNLVSNTYTWTDVSPAEGDNYYRIRSKDADGKISYSEVMKVSAPKLKGDIKVFPNPVVDNTIHLQIDNQPGGSYDLKLINSSGQVVMTKKIQYAGGISAETIRPSMQIPKGIYQLEVTRPDGSKMNIHLMY